MQIQILTKHKVDLAEAIWMIGELGYEASAGSWDDAQEDGDTMVYAFSVATVPGTYGHCKASVSCRSCDGKPGTYWLTVDDGGNGLASTVIRRMGIEALPDK